jgi:prolyl-tRNA synthetase
VGKENVAKVSNELYETLTQNGVEVLYDDRQESAGVKFKDADLIGLPIRVVVSARNIKQGVVEIRLRSRKDAETAPLNEAVAHIKGLTSL